MDVMDLPVLDALVPDPAQEDAIRRIVTEPTRAALNAAQTGTGKTLIAVESAKRMGASVVMISAPLHTFEGWATTILRQYGGDVKIYVINKTTKAGREGLAALDWATPGFYLVSREFWRLRDWSKTHVDLMVHDECHTLSNHDSTGSKLARRIAKGWIRSDFTILQSATPFGSTFAGAWAIGRSLWPDLIDSSRVRWEREHCALETDFAALARQRAAKKAGVRGAEHMNTVKVLGEAQPGSFVSSLPCYVYIPSTVGEPREQEIHVELTRSQRKMYDDFESKGVAWLNDNPMVAELPVVQRIRLRQMTLGECSIDDEGHVTFADDCKSAKLDTLQNLLADLQDEKVLVVTDSAKFARVAAKRIGGFAWTGEATGEQRANAKADFMYNDLQYIVATQASMSEGTDGLQHASHIMVILSENDQNLLNTQMIGRLNRKGQVKRVLVYKITAAKTLDDKQAITLLTKAMHMRNALEVEAAA